MKPMSQAIQEGIKLVEGLRPDEAMKHFQGLLSDPGEATEARVWLGRIALLRGEIEKAEALLDTVLQRNPAHAEALALKGIVRSRMGDSESAVRLLEEAQKHDPQLAMVYINLAINYRQMNRLEDSLEAARKGAQCDPQNPQTHLELARTLWQRGEKADAIDTATEILEIDAAFLPVYLDLGSWLGAEDEFEAAITVCSQGVELFPKVWELREQLSLLYLATDKVSEAVAQARSLVDGRKLPADYIHLAHCLVAAHDMEGAQRALEEAIRTEPDNWDGYLQLADLLQMMGAQAKAEEKYREAAQHSGASPVPGNALGLFLLNGNRAGDARPVLEKALSLAPEVVETRLNLALCLGNMGQIMEAEQLAREVLTTTPSDSQNHQNAARLLQSISNPPKSNA